jgi:protein-arginine kinase activator protein McsA
MSNNQIATYQATGEAQASVFPTPPPGSQINYVYHQHQYFYDPNARQTTRDTTQEAQPTTTQGQIEYPQAETTQPTTAQETSSNTNRSSNTTFCDAALRDRLRYLKHNERRSAESYKRTCSDCGMEYRGPHTRRNRDPSVCLEFQSHLGARDEDGENLFGCLICYEGSSKSIWPMSRRDWSAHVKRHMERGECDRYGD